MYQKIISKVCKKLKPFLNIKQFTTQNRKNLFQYLSLKKVRPLIKNMLVPLLILMIRKITRQVKSTKKLYSPRQNTSAFSIRKHFWTIGEITVYLSVVSDAQIWNFSMMKLLRRVINQSSEAILGMGCMHTAQKIGPTSKKKWSKKQKRPEKNGSKVIQSRKKRQRS